MKIVYGAGPRWGSLHPIEGFLSNTSHQVKVAGYGRHLTSLEVIDWTLDGCGGRILPTMINDIQKFAPDLIISDGELLTAKIAYKLNIPYYSCSALHLFDGLSWEPKTVRYTRQLQDLRKFWEPFPPPEKKLIYSPFGDLSMRPIIRDGFEWIRPYHDKCESGKASQSTLAVCDPLRRKSIEEQFWPARHDIALQQFASASYRDQLSSSSWLLTSGETKYVADAVYNQKRLCVLPSMADVEALLNGLVVTSYNFGQDLGQIEYLERYGIDYLLRAYRTQIDNKLSLQDLPFLHERIV